MKCSKVFMLAVFVSAKPYQGELASQFDQYFVDYAIQMLRNALLQVEHPSHPKYDIMLPMMLPLMVDQESFAQLLVYHEEDIKKTCENSGFSFTPEMIAEEIFYHKTNGLSMEYYSEDASS